MGKCGYCEGGIVSVKTIGLAAFKEPCLLCHPVQAGMALRQTQRDIKDDLMRAEMKSVQVLDVYIGTEKVGVMRSMTQDAVAPQDVNQSVNLPKTRSEQVAWAQAYEGAIPELDGVAFMPGTSQLVLTGRHTVDLNIACFIQQDDWTTASQVCKALRMGGARAEVMRVVSALRTRGLIEERGNKFRWQGPPLPKDTTVMVIPSDGNRKEDSWTDETYQGVLLVHLKSLGDWTTFSAVLRDLGLRRKSRVRTAVAALSERGVVDWGKYRFRWKAPEVA